MKLAPTYKNIHNSFRFNGQSFNRKLLKEAAYCFVKEGDSFERETGLFLLDWLDNNPTIVLKTSGSTGTPKNIEMPKQSLVNSALLTGNWLDLGPRNTALNVLPSTYIAGKMMWIRSMILGLSLDTLTPSKSPLNQLEKVYDFTALTPQQLTNSIPYLHRFKKVIVGGAPISAQTIIALKDTSTKVYETYGMTETVSHIAARQLCPGTPSDSFITLDGVSVAVDARRCLAIVAPHIDSRSILTNDVAVVDTPHSFKILGRIDHVVNSGGIKIFPEEIEKILSCHIQKRFFVSHEEDQELGQKLIVVIEGYQDENLKNKILFDISFPKHKRPKSIYFSEHFIETQSGKIDRISTLQKLF